MNDFVHGKSFSSLSVEMQVFPKWQQVFCHFYPAAMMPL